jgi:hypothetical protein
MVQALRQHMPNLLCPQKHASPSRAAAATPPYVMSQHTSAYVGIRRHTSAYVGVRQHMSAYVSIRQHTFVSGSTRVPSRAAAATPPPHPAPSSPPLTLPSSSFEHRRPMRRRDVHTSAYVSIRQHTSAYLCRGGGDAHTSAYVSIRQHTSAYVSIPMQRRDVHTSAYVSIRQHTYAKEGSAAAALPHLIFRRPPRPLHAPHAHSVVVAAPSASVFVLLH